MKVLLILGHPRTDSLGASLLAAYADGAQSAGVDLNELVLTDLNFDPNVRYQSPRDQPLEKDLQRAQDLIREAEHIVFVFPTWWGTMPALLKGFLDRVFTPEFAFEYQADGHYRPLLKGKTAEIVTTMDTPHWVFRWIYGRPGIKSLKLCTLGFCGIETVRAKVYGPVITSSLAQRTQWIQETRKAGRRLSSGVRSVWQSQLRRASSWLLAIRPQFYPMTFIAYALGASAINTTVDWALFWLGYALLFFLEVATVLTNDYFDFDSDRRNDNAGPFTGGSRMLVEQRLSFKQVQIATGVAITAAAGVFTLLITRGVSLAACVAIALLSVFALGYTVPPLKLSHRGFGEIDVALTHSAGVIAVGYFLQGGDWRELTPWLLSVPLFLAVFAAILLSGIPDHEADRAANKNTLVVKSGKKPALIIAVLSVLAAAVTATMFAIAGYSNAYGWGVFAIDVHAAYLVHKLLGHLRNHNPQRIDGLMVVALTYIIWFGALPLWHFAWSSASR